MYPSPFKETDKNYAKVFFDSIKVIRHSRFSHYLIKNEGILEINSMKAVYLEMKQIENMLDELDWGVLYPVYCWYKNIRYQISKARFHRRNEAELRKLRKLRKMQNA